MKKIKALLPESIKVLFAGMFTFVLLDVMLLSYMDYYKKQKFTMSNISLLFISLTILISLSVILYKKYYLIEKFLSKNWKRKIALAVILLFILQIYVCRHVCFFTGWDACNVMVNAKRIACGNIDKLDNVYFSRYPNNVFLAGFFSECIKICSNFGISSEQNQLIFIAVIQCALSSISGLLIFLTIKDWLKSFTLAWFGWVLYVLLLGTSPWLVVQYSDSMGILIPILILFIYHHTMNGRYTYIKWAAISMAAFIGYQIKPQTVIVFIAVVIIQSINFIADFNYKKLKKAAAVVGIMAVAVLVMFKVNDCYKNSLGFKFDKNKEIGMMHFAMMGLNNVTDGVYYANDVKYSFDFHDVKLRNEGNMKVIKERIVDYKAGDFIMHVIRKVLINFNDGTFAYGKEGGFYNRVYPYKDNVISPALRNVLWVPGKYYPAFASSKQSIWLLVLFMMIAFVFKYSRFNIEGKGEQTLYLSVIGITVFEMIFEPRARYLIVYAPFFIIAAVIGWRHVIKNINRNNIDKKENV